MKDTLKLTAFLVAAALIIVVAYFVYDSVRVRSLPEKLAAIIHDEDSRDAGSRLIDYCSDPEPLVREKAAIALGRIGAQGAGKILYVMLEDSSLDVAAAAAFAIGLTSDSIYAARLADAAYDLPSGVGAWAVTSIGRLCDSTDTDVIDKLASFLSHPSPEVREATCLALFTCGAKSKAVDIMQLLKTEPDDGVRVKGLYALSRMGIAEASGIYEDFLTDTDPWVRSLAVHGLGRVEGEDALRYIGMALNDADRRVVVQAVYELKRKSDDKSKKMLARKFAEEAEENLIIQMLAGLQAQQNDQGLDRSMGLLEESDSENIVAAALDYIAAINKERAVALIDSMLVSSSGYIKQACAEAYGLVGRANVVKRLATLFNDEDPDVRATAFSALAKVDSSDFDFFVGRALDDRDFVPVCLAIDQIGSRKLSKYLPKLLEIRDTEPPVDVNIRRALVDAAASFLTENKADSAAMQLLLKAAIDREYVVRLDATRVYATVLGENRPELMTRVRTRISEGEIESALEKYTKPPQAEIQTSKGLITIELDIEAAPLTVINFIKLAENGYYDGLIFHRVVPNFVIQGGDPRGDGWGGPGYEIRCEYSRQPYIRGSVGIATSGKDTGGSQFFITHSPQPHLDARYTLFGQVLTGMEVVDQIVRGDTIESITIQEHPL